MQINNGALIGQMHKLIPENQIGDFKIEHHIATSEDVKFWKLRSAIHNHYDGYGYHDFEQGTYTELFFLKSKQSRLLNLLLLLKRIKKY